ANEIAMLATSAMPFVTMAAGKYGEAVLKSAWDKAGDATVGAGLRILQRVFGRNEEGEPLPEPVADVIANPGEDEYVTVLKMAIRKALERDEEMAAEVRGIVAEAPQPGGVTQNVYAGRDAYTAGRDMTVNQRSE
ncbi:MAG: hypothetical protein FWE35_17235, partial [Streptosporangiales bacterium]|nr:hypothetical protein [Streptosporangiales bacterium]